MHTLRAYLNAERGRTTKLAAALGISAAAISLWSRVPAERVIAVERITGIPRRHLRPDLYPPEPASTEAA